MFAVITGKEAVYQNGGIFRKGFSVKAVAYPGGSYRLVTLKSRRVKWKKLSGELGAAAAHAVVCNGIVLPADCGIIPQDTAEISYVFLKNAVEYLLLNTPIPITRWKTARCNEFRGGEI